MYESVLQAVIQSLSQVIDDKEITITPESHLIDDLELSSYELLQLLIRLEDEHGLEIPERYFRRMLTVKDAAQVITELAQG